MPSNVTSWRANMKIGTGPPGHYESEIVSSNWCDTREKAEAEAKKRALEYLDGGDKKNCILSFLSNSRKWNLYEKDSSIWELLTVAMINPSVIDTKFIEGLN